MTDNWLNDAIVLSRHVFVDFYSSECLAKRALLAGWHRQADRYVGRCPASQERSFFSLFFIAVALAHVRLCLFLCVCALPNVYLCAHLYAHFTMVVLNNLSLSVDSIKPICTCIVVICRCFFLLFESFQCCSFRLSKNY